MCALKRYRFFPKTRLLVRRGRPASQGPSHDATFYAPSFLRNNFCKLHTFSFFCPVSVFFAQERPPNEFFCTFFGSVFGRARVQISNVPLLKSVFFQKSAFFSLRRRFWPPAANFGASLRRPNWPCLEYLLLFYKIFFKMGSALSRDAISA